MELDDFDRRILARYQHDTRLTAESIGADVGLSAAAVQRRLKRMREGGVIQAEVAKLSPEALGVPLTCIVTVDIAREGAADIDRFARRMRTLPEVQQCWYVTGSADFVLVVTAADMARYEAFTRAHLLSDDNVASFTTYVSMQRVKSGLALPLPVPD